MSYLLPLNTADNALDRYEPVCFPGVQSDDDDDAREPCEREPFQGGSKSGRGELRSEIDEMREFRWTKRDERCERDERPDRDERYERGERADLDDRRGREIELEREPRKGL